MEFRLIYQGPLPPEKCQDKGPRGGSEGRAKDKHRLRKHFHHQLRELWKQHPNLREQSERLYRVYVTPPNLVSAPGPGVRQVFLAQENLEGAKTWLEHIAENNRACNNNRFVPLVSKEGGLTCSLDILFLRRSDPGNLIESGDIDNRIKVLLDGLRMPTKVSELGGYAIEADEDPFFCLLGDDKLVSGLSVTTDRLILPLRSDEHINDVLLLIHVTVSDPATIFAGGKLL